VQRQDVRVGQPGGDFDLAQEALGAECRGDLGTQHLDRDQATVLQVPREVDRRHPAAPQLALECVAPSQRRAEGLELVSHRCGAALSRWRAARASATYGWSWESA